MEFDKKISLGNVVTIVIVAATLAVQWGSNNVRLAAVEVVAAKAVESNQTLTITLVSVETTLVRVQTQMDEREKRFDAAVSAQTSREDQRDLHRK